MRNLLLFFFLFFWTINVVFASQKVNCDPYLDSKKNYLFNLGLVGGNTEDPDAQSSVELFPDKEVKGNTQDSWIQYYDLSKYHYYKYIMLQCVYNDGRSIIKEIPKSMNLCTKEYTTANPKNLELFITNFSCK